MKSKNSNFKLLTSSLGVLAIATLVCFLAYHPLPDDFEEPWKYRLIKFGVEITSFLAHYLESWDIIHQVNVTRLSYHMSYGIVNIRDPNDNITVIDEEISHLSIRIFRPYESDRLNNHSDKRPTILFYHGGGYLVGSADIFEPVTYLLAKYTNYQVIYVEYRLIPEHKYPTAYEDSFDAAIHLIDNHAKYQIDLDNFILMGDSAGGNLAAVISQQLMEKNILKPKLQVLIYPILQFFDFTLPSYQTYLPKRVLGSINHENFKKFLNYFTGHQIDDDIFFNGHTSQALKEKYARYVNHSCLPMQNKVNFNPLIEHLNDTSNKYAELVDKILSITVSPLLADDDYLIRNTPDQTILITAEIDILRDDGFIYAHRLRHLGKSVLHKHYKNLFHGIFGLIHGPFKFEKAHHMVKTVSNMIKKIMLK